MVVVLVDCSLCCSFYGSTKKVYWETTANSEVCWKSGSPSLNIGCEQSKKTQIKSCHAAMVSNMTSCCQGYREFAKCWPVPTQTIFTPCSLMHSFTFQMASIQSIRAQGLGRNQDSAKQMKVELEVKKTWLEDSEYCIPRQEVNV